MGPPEMGFVPASEETDPESKTQLGDQAGWLEPLPLMSQRLFGAQYLIALDVLQRDASVFVPAWTERMRRSLVNFIAQCDLKALDGSIKRFTQRGIPYIKTKCLRGVPGSDALVSLQPLR
jgi:hypothetical protein